jgi:hypothetical protein
MGVPIAAGQSLKPHFVWELLPKAGSFITLLVGMFRYIQNIANRGRVIKGFAVL